MKNGILFFLVSALFPCMLTGQVTSTSPAAGDTLKTVHIISTDRYGYKQKDSLTELQLLSGHVVLRQDSTTFYCDSAVFNKGMRIVEAFGNIHINDRDSVHTYSQYLLYYVDSKIANLKKQVKLTNGRTTLLTEELQYDMNQKTGEYHTGGKVLNGKSELTSLEGIYYTDIKDAYFKNNVLLKDPAYTLESDSLLYNTQTEITTFIALTNIRDSTGRKIRTRDGYYDLKNKKAFFSKRSVIEDGAVRIIANETETNDSTGISKLRGNAVFVDTSQGVSVLANYIESNRDEKSFLATLHPLMIIKQDKDSIYVTADTLFSGRLSRYYPEKDSTSGADSAGDKSLNSEIPKAGKDSTVVNDSLQLDPASIKKTVAGNDSTDRFFRAWYHVRIFSDSMQSVADSLFYSGMDSIFRLFRDPIVWASGNQITGDTIYLYTKNKQADRMFVRENGFAINKAGSNLFNQVRGNRLFGYFVEGAIDRLQARGSAESIYYVKDDDGLLVGVNKAKGDIIELRFHEKELNRVVFISEVSGTLYPVKGLTGDEQQLRNFRWLEEKRPKTKFELFSD